MDTCLQFLLRGLPASAEMTTHSLSLEFTFLGSPASSAPAFSISDSSSPLVLEIQVFFRPLPSVLSLPPFPW